MGRMRCVFVPYMLTFLFISLSCSDAIPGYVCKYIWRSNVCIFARMGSATVMSDPSGHFGSGILLVGSCSLRCCCITGETAILTMFPKPFHAFFSLALTGGLPPDRPRLRSTTGHPNYLRSLIAMLLTFLFGKSLFNDTCIRARAEAREILGLLSQLDENVC